MAEKMKIGRVFSYFSKVGVAAIELTDGPMKVGDKILIQGHTTNFEQTVDSIQIDRTPLQEAAKGKSVGIKVNDVVRPNDIVYKIM